MSQKKINPSSASLSTPTSPLLDKLIRLHLYLLIFLIPLFFWPDTLTVFTIPKLLILRTLSISSGVFILLKLFLTDKVTFRFSKSYIFLGFWLLSLILSTVFTLDLSSSLFGQYGRYLGIFTMLNFLLIPVFVVNFFTPSQTKKLLQLSVIASSLAALYGFFQYFNFFDLIKFPYNWSDSPQNRVFGTFGHANHLGGYLAAHALILVFYPGYNWLKKQNFLIKIIYPLILLLHLATLVLTASRGALLAFILGLLICFCAAYFLKPKNSSKKNKSRLKPIIIALTLLALIAASLYSARDTLSDLGLFKRTEATVATIDKGKIPDRLSFLYSALSMFVDHPIIGTGLSTFRDAYSAYRRTDYYIDGPGNAQFITVPEAAHDEFANVLATQGAIGFLAYILLIGAALRILFINIRNDNKSASFSRNYYLALLGALLAYLIETIFNFGEINNLFLLYLLLGLIFSTDQVFQKSFSLRGIFAKTAEIIFIFVMLVLLVFAFNYGVINEGQADYYLKNAEQDNLNHHYSGADKDYQLAIAARPQEYSIYQLYGDFLLATSTTSTDPIILQNYYKNAIDNYQQSIQLNNNYPSTYHNLALAYLQMFRLTKQSIYQELSQQSYQIAVQKGVNNPRYPYEYARKLDTDFNDPVQAITLLKQAIAIDPDYQEPHDYLNFLYKKYPQLTNPLKT